MRRCMLNGANIFPCRSGASTMTDSSKDTEIDSAVYKTLLESTKAIPWKIDWHTMRFAYIGPQIESLLGWSPASWVTVKDWATRIHPEDRERVVNFCVARAGAGAGRGAGGRARARGGGRGGGRGGV